MTVRPDSETGVDSSGTAPVASLIVPSFRGERRLPVLLEALRGQQVESEWEVIIVLDGVADDSESVLRAVDDLPIRVVKLPENRGRSAALNAGFAAAQGRVLVRCDDDLEPAPSYISNHLAAHEGADEVGAVGLYRNVLPPTPYTEAYGRWADEQVRASAYSLPENERWYHWAGNCSVSAAVFDRVGPYDEAFSGYGWEDIDWGYRLFQAGVAIVLDPRLETRHHAANVTTAIRVRRAFQSGLARARFDAKHDLATRQQRDPNLDLLQRGWSNLVDLFAREDSLDGVEARGERLDRWLPRMPRSLGKRSVALLVESADRAGYRSKVVRAS